MAPLAPAAALARSSGGLTIGNNNARSAYPRPRRLVKYGQPAVVVHRASRTSAACVPHARVVVVTSESHTFTGRHDARQRNNDASNGPARVYPPRRFVSRNRARSLRQGGCRRRLCKLDPGLKAPRFQRFNLSRYAYFQLEPCFLRYGGSYLAPLHYTERRLGPGVRSGGRGQRGAPRREAAPRHGEAVQVEHIRLTLG